MTCLLEGDAPKSDEEKKKEELAAARAKPTRPHLVPPLADGLTRSLHHSPSSSSALSSSFISASGGARSPRSLRPLSSSAIDQTSASSLSHVRFYWLIFSSCFMHLTFLYLVSCLYSFSAG